MHQSRLAFNAVRLTGRVAARASDSMGSGFADLGRVR
jgi:hypothetical protein